MPRIDKKQVFSYDGQSYTDVEHAIGDAALDIVNARVCGNGESRDQVLRRMEVLKGSSDGVELLSALMYLLDIKNPDGGIPQFNLMCGYTAEGEAQDVG